MADERRQRPPRSQPGPVSDIERFLMEVERLRKKSAHEKQVDDVQMLDDVEVVRPAAPPPPPPRPAVRPRPRPIETYEVPAVVDVLPAQPTQARFAAPPAPAAAVPAAPRIATFRSGPPGGQIAQQVVAMLRSKDQARAAILIGEILGPPASRRRR